MLIPAKSWGEDIAIDSSLVKTNFNSIKNKIAHYNVKIIAVTKYFGLKAIEAGYEAGLRDFGESRVNEAIEKINKLPKHIIENATFHFIGHLQSNKVEKAVRYFDVIHSVDSLKIAQAISKTACSLNKKERIFLQVNNSGEEQKSGYTKQQLDKELKDLMSLNGIEILGLMNMAPLGADSEVLKNLFSDIKNYRDKLEKKYNIALPELSMGMSDDYEIAVQEGATIIRIGRKLFTV